MNIFFWRKNKKQPNDEALDFLTIPSEEVKNRKKLKLDEPVESPDVPFSEQEKMAEIEGKYLQLQPKGKKGVRKKILQIGFLILVCTMSIVLLATIDFDGEKLSLTQLMLNANNNGWWVFLAFFSFVLLITIDAFRISYITKLTTGRFRPVVATKVSLLGRYYDNITPLATGGQPFQIYYLAKKDIPAGVASAIPLIRYFVLMIAMFIFSIALVAFNSWVLLGIDPAAATSIHVLAYIGITFNIALPFIFLTISLWPKFGKKFISLILKLLRKLKLIKDYQKSYYKTLKTVNEYRNSLKLMIKKKFHLLALIIISVGEFFLLGSIPYFLCVGFGGIDPGTDSWLSIVTLYAFVMNASAILPTPGNAGGAELSFALVFAGVNGISSGSIFWIVLFWRIITYYSYILVGLIIVFIDFFRNLFKEKIIQRNKLTTTKEMVISGLNSWDSAQRRATTTVLKNIEKSDRWFAPKTRERDIKLFLKTSYSSGPYSPTALAYKCYENGSKIVGICDSETLSGAKEFYETCRTLGMGCSIGVQVKTVLIKPKLNRRINNMYQPDIANLAIIGIPYEKIDYVNNFLAKHRGYRSDRVQRITDLINRQYKKIGVSIDFKRDVLPISNEKEGGTVTEMHVILALCNQLVLRYGKGQNLVDVLRVQMDITIPEKSRKLLITSSDENSFVYDLQNILRNEIRRFYIEADKECCSISDLRKIAEECQAILTYEYMGDIEQTVFGEVRAEAYEDDILDYLLKELKKLGVTAVTVSPSRHTFEQIERIKALGKELELLVIINETIYTRRQEIKYAELEKEQNLQIIENSYAVCGNERAILNQIGGFFSVNAVSKYPDINVRAAVFSELGKASPQE